MSIEPYLQFADRLAEATLIVSGAGIILAANRVVASRLGLDPQRLRRKRLVDVVSEPPDATARYLRACSQTSDALPGALTFVSDGGAAVTCRTEGVLLRPRTEVADALIMLRLIPKETSTQQFVALNQRINELNREIVRRKRVEEELLEQRELLRVTLASIGDAVIATDTRGQVVFVNTVAERMTGWTQGEAFGRPLDEVFRIVNEESRAAIESPVPKALRDGVAIDLANHTLLIARDGTERAIDDSAAPIRMRGGEVKGIVLVFHDITERRRMEKELLQRAAKLAEADQAKDEFLAMLAHELRNPLAPIRNALQILRREDTEQADLPWALGIMERHLGHLTRLVDDLLDVSRITRHRIELRVERVDLADIVAQAVEITRPFIESKHQELIVSVAPEPLLIDADPVRLEQILGNLLNNAAKYTQEGGRIGLSAAREANTIVVSVRDNGMGIVPELQARIFDLFMQADRSLDRTQGGLGIGLTMVHTLVKLHGGTVSVRSEGLGRGSEFLVRLPAARPAAPELPRAGSRPTQLVKVPRRVLVVDDNADSAQSLGRLLRRWGHDVHLAYTGPEALALADSAAPDVMLLDIGLPEMDGYEVARRLRRDPRYDQTTLVALTGYGREMDRRRSQAAGIDMHLVKPVDPDVLQEVLATPPRDPVGTRQGATGA